MNSNASEFPSLAYHDLRWVGDICPPLDRIMLRMKANGADWDECGWRNGLTRSQARRRIKRAARRIIQVGLRADRDYAEARRVLAGLNARAQFNRS